jgi:YD repeat-containing protein
MKVLAIGTNGEQIETDTSVATIGTTTYVFTNGQLTSSNGPDGDSAFTYNASGSLIGITQVVGAVTRVRTIAYNPDGSLASITTT